MSVPVDRLDGDRRVPLDPRRTPVGGGVRRGGARADVRHADPRDLRRPSAAQRSSDHRRVPSRVARGGRPAAPVDQGELHAGAATHPDPGGDRLRHVRSGRARGGAADGRAAGGDLGERFGEGAGADRARRRSGVPDHARQRPRDRAGAGGGARRRPAGRRAVPGATGLRRPRHVHRVRRDRRADPGRGVGVQAGDPDRGSAGGRARGARGGGAGRGRCDGAPRPAPPRDRRLAGDGVELRRHDRRRSRRRGAAGRRARSTSAAGSRRRGIRPDERRRVGCNGAPTSARRRSRRTRTRWPRRCETVCAATACRRTASGWRRSPAARCSPTRASIWRRCGT